MRIPQVYLENLQKRYKKHRKDSIDEANSEIFNNIWEQVSYYISKKQQILLLQDPISVSKVLDCIDSVLEEIITYFQKGDMDSSKFGLELTHAQITEQTDSLVDFIVQCTDVQKFRELFFSYDRLLDLVFWHPQYDLDMLRKIMCATFVLLPTLNQNKTPKFKSIFFAYKLKVEQLEKQLVRWHYLLVFLQQGINSLSPESFELCQLSSLPQGRSIRYQLPHQDMCDYNHQNEFLLQKKVIKEQQEIILITKIDWQGRNPYEMAKHLLKGKYDVSESCTLFDQMFVRLFCEYNLKKSNAYLQLQLLSSQCYNYLVYLQIQELFIINQNILSDIQIRMIDQKDYILQIIRLLAMPISSQKLKDERGLYNDLLKSISSPLQLFSQKAQALLPQDVGFTEKIQLFMLNIFQDKLNQYRSMIQIDASVQLPFTSMHEQHVLEKIGDNHLIMQVFFQQLQDHNFRPFFKRQQHYTMWCNLIIQITSQIVYVGQDNQTYTQLCQFDQGKTLVHHLTYMILDCPLLTTQSTAQVNQLDSQMESNIITCLITLAREMCKFCKQDKSQASYKFLNLVFTYLNSLMNHFKTEYDQISLQNAQSEHMQPLPERFHRFLSRLWDDQVLVEAVDVMIEMSRETLCVTLLQLFVVVLGESPSRVRLLFEMGYLQKIVEKVQTFLRTVERNSQLLTYTINFLITINTNEQAAQLALLHTTDESKDGLVKQVFNKCYLPSQDQSEVAVSEDFAKKIIMLYSSSKLAKMQIEKVIESTFVTLSQLVDLGQEKIEEIVSQRQRLKQFYTYSKSLQGVLQIFERLHPEKRSYRQYQGFEDLQQEEAFRQKDQLFSSLLKNTKFVEALEKIIMSPILIGSKNKDLFVEHYVQVLVKRGKINPYISLYRELKMIEENYMVVQGRKTIDMNQLIDYDALSVYMSGRYFFRKIIKHISPQTYRGFYIMSRFHLIHYLAKMCKAQGTPDSEIKQLAPTLIKHLLEIYFLSSQHAAFHESVMMQMSAKAIIRKGSVSPYEEDQLIKKKISCDKLIPIQSSCLDLIVYLHTIIASEQKEKVIDYHGQIVLLFLRSIDKERIKIAELPQSLPLLTSVTIAQDMMKSLQSLIQKLIQVDTHVPLQFYNLLDSHSELVINVLGTIIRTTDNRVVSKDISETSLIMKFIPHFRDAILLQSERLVREIFLRKVALDRVELTDEDGQIVTLRNVKQLSMIADELYLHQAYQIKSLLDMACQFKMINSSQEKYDNKTKNVLLESLIDKYFAVKEIKSLDMKKSMDKQSNELQTHKELNQLLIEQQVKRELLKKPFDRPDIKMVLEMVVAMGFSEKLAKKAIKRTEIPEPTLIIDYILQGKVSDDEDEGDEDLQLKDEAEEEYLRQRESIEKLMKLIPQPIQQEEPVDESIFEKLLIIRFPASDFTVPMTEKVNLILEEFKIHLDGLLMTQLAQSYVQLTAQPLNNFSAQQQTVEFLLRLNPKEHHQDILKSAISILFNHATIPTLDNKQIVRTYFSQFSMAYGQLALIKRIYPSVYKKIYNYTTLVDQDDEQPLKLTLINVVESGRTIMSIIKNHLIPELQKECQAIQSIEQGSTFEVLQNQINVITEPINELIEMKSVVTEALFNEFTEAITILVQFTLSGQQTHEQVLDRYWAMIRTYLDFLKEFLRVENQVGQLLSQTYQSFSHLNRDGRETQLLQSGISNKRNVLEKAILRQILYAINDFGLHNQHLLYDFLIQGDLIGTLLDLKMHWYVFEMEDQLVNLLENLISLIGYDRVVVESIIQTQIKQVMLMDHCEIRAIDIMKKTAKKEYQSFDLPYKIEIPLQKVMTLLPSLSNNPSFMSVVLDSPELSIHKFNQSTSIAPPLTKVIGLKQQPQQTQNTYILSWDIQKFRQNNEINLNRNYVQLVTQMCTHLVKNFITSHGPLISFVNEKSSQPQKQGNIVPYALIYSWENLLKTLEFLIPKIPQTVFLLQSLTLSSLGFSQFPNITFIQFIVKYGLWIAPERLHTFFTQYLSESAYISQSYGHQLTNELIGYVMQYIDFTNNDIHIRYHLIHSLTLLTQLLSQQEACNILANTHSKYNIVPKIIETLGSFPKDYEITHPQMFKVLGTTFLKTLEPFLQVQVYLNHMKEGDFGKLQELQRIGSFEYHYYHYLKNALFQQTINSKSLEHLSQVNQFSSYQVQFTLKQDEPNTLEQWPPSLTKKIQVQQAKGQNRSQEEDASDSESDQEITAEPVIRQTSNSLNFTNIYGFGHQFTSWQREDDTSQDYFRKEEDKSKFDASTNIWPQSNLVISVSPSQEVDQGLKFTVPTIYPYSHPKYSCEEDTKENHWKVLKDWEYALVSVYGSMYEKVEKKKILLQRSHDIQIKNNVDILQAVVKLLTKSIHLNNEKLKSVYLNGCIYDFISMNYTMLQLGLIRLPSAKVQHSYPQLTFTQVNGVLSACVHLINTIGFISTNNSLILNKIPCDLSDHMVILSKIVLVVDLLPLLPVQDPINIQEPKQQSSPIFSPQPAHQSPLNKELQSKYDQELISVFRKMLLLSDQSQKLSYFITYPNETLRFLIKCERFSRLFFEMVVKVVLDGDLPTQLKGLWLLVHKFQQQCLRDNFKKYVESSPVVGQNVSHSQSLCQKSISIPEESSDGEDNNIFEDLQQIQTYSMQDLDQSDNPFIQLFQLLHSLITEDTDILHQPLLAFSTTYHQNYVVQIVKLMLQTTVEQTPQTLFEKYEYLKQQQEYVKEREENLFKLKPQSQSKYLVPSGTQLLGPPSFLQQGFSQLSYPISAIQKDLDDKQNKVKDLVGRLIEIKRATKPPSSDYYENMQIEEFMLQQILQEQKLEPAEQDNLNQDLYDELYDQASKENPLAEFFKDQQSQLGNWNAPLELQEPSEELQKEVNQFTENLLSVKQPALDKDKDKKNFEASEIQRANLGNIYAFRQFMVQDPNEPIRSQPQHSQQQQQQPLQSQPSQQQYQQLINQQQQLQLQVHQQQLLQQKLLDLPPPKLQSQPEVINNTITLFELEIVNQLCLTLKCSKLKKELADIIMNSLNNFALDKIKVEYTIRQLNCILQDQANLFNSELEKNRMNLRRIQNQREKDADYDPYVVYEPTEAEQKLIEEFNDQIPWPNIIQRIFQLIQGFLNSSMREQTKFTQSTKKETNLTRQAMAADKKKHSRKPNNNKPGMEKRTTYQQTDCQYERMSRKDIKQLFINILQTPQTYQLWLRTAETLILVSQFKPSYALETLQKKLNPLIECFLNIYKHISEETEFLPNQKDQNLDQSFFDRHLSGSGAPTSSQLIQEQPTHLQRTFSSVRDNSMQLKLDELFTFICFKGKRILDGLISKKIQELQIEVKSNNYQVLRAFKENEPLGYVFFKMSKVVSFENKKHLFEMQLDHIHLQEKQQQGRQRNNRPDQFELIIQRENRLQNSYEKLASLDPIKFRKSEFKIKYQGEKGQDEGGLRREWFTNIIKDILETNKFEMNPQRFYRISLGKLEPADILIYKFLGRMLAKALYDGYLVPAYLISPIYKSILDQTLNFEDLEHFNDSYYESYQKFVQEDCVVTYQDLVECWIPEGYLSILDDNKLLFSQIIQDHLTTRGDRKDSEAQDDELKKDEDLQLPQLPNSKKQSIDNTADIDKEEVLAQRKQKRLNRRKQYKQNIVLSDNVLQTINIQELFANNTTQVPLKIRKQICLLLSRRIMMEEIKIQIQAIKDGFYEIIQKDNFAYLDWRDLQKLIMGVPQVDINDLQQNTEYVNYSPDSQIIGWFWEVLKTMTDAEKADFLMFSTGSPLVPFGGFKNLKGLNSFKKFTITKDFHPEHLIKAHTCFYRIDLPEYPNKEVLRDKLFKSLREGGPEFDLS